MADATRPLTPFERTKACDLLFALPAIAWFGSAIVRDYPNLSKMVVLVVSGHADADAFANLSVRVAAALLPLVVIAFLVFRFPPTAKARGLAPQAIALLGGFLGVGFRGLTLARMSSELRMVAMTLILAGTVLTIIATAYLGQSFSILPEARRLVTRGPFALVRHPVYVAEETMLFGVMLCYAQPWALFLFLLQASWQFARVRQEERVLSEAFPEYADYCARTARFVPGVY